MHPLLAAALQGLGLGSVEKLRLPTRQALQGALSAQSAMPARRRNPTTIRRLKAAEKFVAARDKRSAPIAPKRLRSKSDPAQHVQALRAALHDSEAFPKAFQALQGDRGLGREAVVRIASDFAFPMGSKTSKKLALQRIREQHEKSEAFATRLRSIRGKNAG